MDDLFEQLKKAPAVNKNTKTPPTREFLSPTPLKDFEIKRSFAKSSSRRESLPTARSTTSILKKLNSHKSRSLSPPKHLTKPFRVLIERKKLEDLMSKTKDKQKKSPSKSASKTIADAYRELFKLPTSSGKTVKSPDKKDKLSKVNISTKSPTKTEKAITLDKSIKEPKKVGRPPKALDKSINSPAKVIKIVDKTTPSKKSSLSNSGSNSSIGNSSSSPKKVTLTPTKAQKKQFFPETVPLFQNLSFQQRGKKQKKIYKIKRCEVRLPRQNLKKLQQKFLHLRSKNGKIPGRKSNTPQATKRKSSDKDSPSPTKRAKESNKKEPTGFFIKLSTPSTLKGQNKKQQTKKAEFKNRVNLNHKSYKSGSTNSSYKSLSSTTKPTKFTRTHLIKAFGKRFFKSHVKIEKCNHPMMLIFESNARARKLKAKRNKSKNLSVSFKEQVEIFGCTDSEDFDSSDSDSDVEYRPKGASARKTSFSAALNKSLNASGSLTPLLATPARLKKFENGKLIDDIELDPSLFLDPSVVGVGGSSTPYGHSPGRKKREKKSFSPLKGDAISSPRKEQFKLANEKMPPSGLRRLNIDDVDDEDDEDDDCEYIVPIEIPQRRTSRTNSNNAAEYSSSYASAIEGSSTNFSGNTTALDRPNEIEDDAPTPDDLRLDAPTPDDLELDAPTPEGIDMMVTNDEVDISSRVSDAGSEKDVDNYNKEIFAPIANKKESTAEAAEQESMADQNDESYAHRKANEKDQDVDDEEAKQLNENVVLATKANGNNKNGSVATDKRDTAKEQRTSLTMFAEDSQDEEDDIIGNILKERIDEIVKDVEINNASKTVKESNNLETSSSANVIEE